MSGLDRTRFSDEEVQVEEGVFEWNETSNDYGKTLDECLFKYVAPTQPAYNPSPEAGSAA